MHTTIKNIFFVIRLSTYCCNSQESIKHCFLLPCHFGDNHNLLESSAILLLRNSALLKMLGNMYIRAKITCIKQWTAGVTVQLHLVIQFNPILDAQHSVSRSSVGEGLWWMQEGGLDGSSHAHKLPETSTFPPFIRPKIDSTRLKPCPPPPSKSKPSPSQIKILNLP